MQESQAQGGNERSLPNHYDRIDWNEVVLLTFKAGTTRRAIELTHRCLAPARLGADVPIPHVVEMPRGPWNVMLLYTLAETPLDVRWETPANLAKLRRAFTAVYGIGGAEECWVEFESLIARSTSFVGFSERQGRALAQQ